MRSRIFIKELSSYSLCNATKRDEMYLTRMIGFNGSVKKKLGAAFVSFGHKDQNTSQHSLQENLT